MTARCGTSRARRVPSRAGPRSAIVRADIRPPATGTEDPCRHPRSDPPKAFSARGLARPARGPAGVWSRAEIRLVARPRGVHLVTREVVAGIPDLGRVRVGLAHLFLRHTSASLALNENASPDVRADLEAWLSRAAPDGAPYFRHTLEGPDDMPAHVKAVIVGASLTLPIVDGRLDLGTWQGVYLCEHRDHGGSRTVTATLWGEG